jgi:hypothetical protein
VLGWFLAGAPGWISLTDQAMAAKREQDGFRRTPGKIEGENRGNGRGQCRISRDISHRERVVYERDHPRGLHSPAQLGTGDAVHDALPDDVEEGYEIKSVVVEGTSDGVEDYERSARALSSAGDSAFRQPLRRSLQGVTLPELTRFPHRTVDGPIRRTPMELATPLPERDPRLQITGGYDPQTVWSTNLPRT